MTVIAVPVHAYDRNYSGRPWAGHLHGPASATGEEMVAAMDAVGVDAAIIVSTFNLYRYDPSYALEVYAKYPERFRVVKPIDPANPALDDGTCVAQIGGHLNDSEGSSSSRLSGCGGSSRSSAPVTAWNVRRNTAFQRSSATSVVLATKAGFVAIIPSKMAC